MSFDYNLSGYFDDESVSIRRIMKSREVYERAKKDKEYADTVEKMALLSYVNSISDAKTIYDYLNMSEVRSQFYQKGKSTKKGRDSVEVFTDHIKSDFLNGISSNFTLTDFVTQGIEGYAYRAEFSIDGIDGHTFFIEIPRRDAITPANIVQANYGKFAFGVHEDICIEQLFSSYSESKLSEKITEYFKSNFPSAVEEPKESK